MKGHSKIIPIWENEIPNYIDTGEKEIIDQTTSYKFLKIQQPTIEIFLPSKRNATGQGILIFPGGGYECLSYDREGTDIAKWLNGKGIAAFVIKSRLPDNDSSVVEHLSPLIDAKRALQYVRYHAASFHLNKNKIGVFGFSAGGHLAGSLSVHFDKELPTIEDEIALESGRPDFSILVYPVISMKDGVTHKGSKQALIGDNPTQELTDFYSLETQVHEEIPPTFLIHASDDIDVPVQNSIRYYEALLKLNVSTEMHIYPFGGHGFSLAINTKHLNTWIDRVGDWLSLRQ